METKLRAMRHRDIWKVVDCDNTGLEKAGGKAYASTATDLEFYLRQQHHMLTVASDCHGIARGYLHADCGTKKNYAVLKRVIAHGDWWRLGIGRQLLGSFVIQCRDAQVDILCDVPFSMLPAAGTFLKHFGFRGTGFYSLGDDEYAKMHWSSAVQLGAA